MNKILRALLIPAVSYAAFVFTTSAEAQTFWRIGLNDGSSSEFTGTSIPSSYTISSNWATQTTWPEWPPKNDWATWQTNINYTLTSVPAGGAVFTFKPTNAMQLVPELAVYSNGNPCGIIQIGSDQSIGWGTYSHNRLFTQPYEIYIPPQFLQTGSNVLHLYRMGHPYATTTTNVWYMDFAIDYMEMDGLAAPPPEPVHSKVTHIGLNEGDTNFANDSIGNAAQALFEWLGIAYSGNPERVAFWSNNGWEQNLTNQINYLNTLKSLNMTAILNGLSCENTTDAMIVGGQLPAGDKAWLNTFFTNFGSKAQIYELTNEPCQSFTNASYLYCTTAAQYIKTIKPSNILLTAPGYSYGGGSGQPVNWDQVTSNRQALDAICDAYAGHSFGSPGWGMDNGDLAATIDADGLYVGSLPEFLEGFDKLFVTTECGAGDTLYENISQIPSATRYATALDRNLRANTAFTDYMCFADAFNNGPYDMLDGTYSTPSSWTAHLCGGGKDPISKLQVFRRLALAYGTHGSPLPFTYNGIPTGTYPLTYFRAVNTATLAPLPGSGATANKLLLSFVNFDYFNSNTINVSVTMPGTGTYSGVCYGAGNTIAAAKTSVSLPTDANGVLTFSLTLPPGESTEYILDPIANYLTNPGFETGSLSGWTVWVGANGSATYAGNTASEHHSGNWCLVNWSPNAYRVTTYQTVSVPNGVHTISAWVMNGGGQTTCRMEVSNYGGSIVYTNIPVTGNWTKISTSVNVTNGTLEVAFYSDAGANQWVNIDDVEVN